MAKKKINYGLFILNDTSNTFEDVMLVLEMCLGFNIFQAEQIATIIHYKGECRVLVGEQEDMEEFSEVIMKHGLTTKVMQI
jgi:ATP-dependent Clp protease adapter protein ClpS